MDRHQKPEQGHPDAPPLAVAYPWIEETQYALARQVMIDGDLWPQNYDVWRREAERAMGALSAEGVMAVKAPLNPDEFAAWCRANDCPADSAARLAFAEVVAWLATGSHYLEE